MQLFASLFAFAVCTWVPIFVHAQQQRIVIQAPGSDASNSFGEMVFSLNAIPLASTGDIVSMLGDTGIHQELELVAYQQRQLIDTKAKYDNLIKKAQSRQRKDETESEKRSRQQEIEELQIERKQMMEEILLPHQAKRLKQVALQMKMKHRGDIQMLTDDKLVELLEISKQQQDKLKKRAKEIKAELDAEIIKLKQEARDKLLRELSPTQRTQLKKMLGEDYDPKQKDKKDKS